MSSNSSFSLAINSAASNKSAPFPHFTIATGEAIRQISELSFNLLEVQYVQHVQSIKRALINGADFVSMCPFTIELE